MNTQEIAKICHEVNRAYCESMGDESQLSWEESPDWLRDSVIHGVELHQCGDHSPAATHQSWLEEKKATGWTYGEVKDANEKTHPCCVPFSELPKEQQAKDFIFRAIVRELR